MGPLDNLPDNTEPENPKAAEELLRSMTHDLRSLQQDLVAQLHQDVQRLQAEKSRLVSDIEKLQNQQQLLQSEHSISLSRQQLAQQQAWAKQLALALANHLQAALTQRLSQTLTTHPIQRSVDQRSVAILPPAHAHSLLVALGWKDLCYADKLPLRLLDDNGRQNLSRGHTSLVSTHIHVGRSARSRIRHRRVVVANLTSQIHRSDPPVTFAAVNRWREWAQ